MTVFGETETTPSKGRVVVALEEREGGRIARITIDNRRKLNTLNRALMAEFVAAIEPLAQDL